ncbi:transposase [Limosilactobacillus fermentum]|uniref:transposase n=1 Tax=Limosilactobacillus fermentum TaxID=1613 RepID=UPI00194ED929|nr:transposase [Limosilactobacillus fermentum]
MAISIIRGRLSLFQYPQGINLHKIFYTPRYDKEFKQNIINLYNQGESAAQLAREYGIGYSTVHKWIQGQAKTQSGKSPDEIKAMEKRLASLSEENEILKKSLGFLAQK